jgi:type I restriction enzyme R subunit
MNVDNFIVRAKRQYVEKYAAEGAWENIDDLMIGEIVEHVAPLPSSHSDPDEMAKRFDLLILNLQLCILKANKGFERYSERVLKITEALIDRQDVPSVKAQVPLLMQILEEEFWQDITVPILEVLRIRIRSLVKHIDKTSREIVYTDFQDELGISEIISVTDAAERSLVRFRAKARAFLNDNLNHISLNKLRMNQPLTTSDLSELERFLVDAGIADQSVIERAAEESDGLGIFVRSLVGLDKAAAQDAFSAFIDGKMFNATNYSL